MLREALNQEFKTAGFDRVQFSACLDVQGRATGEVINGAFNHMPNGIVLNLATGVACAFVSGGRVVRSIPRWGATYGNVGRYLIYAKDICQWIFRPTEDGSIPQYDPKSEVRLTNLVGGLALAQRCKKILGYTLPVSPAKALLEYVTTKAYDGDYQALSFIQQIGIEIGQAITCLRRSLLPKTPLLLVLVGGVGEGLGVPPTGSFAPDIFVESIRDMMTGIVVMRSQSDLAAELVGAVRIQ